MRFWCCAAASLMLAATGCGSGNDGEGPDPDDVGGEGGSGGGRGGAEATGGAGVGGANGGAGSGGTSGAGAGAGGVAGTAGAATAGAGGSAGSFAGGSGAGGAGQWEWPSYDDALASPFSTPLLVVLLDFSDSDIATFLPDPEVEWSNLMFGREQGQGNHYWYQTSIGQFQLLPAEESSGTPDNGVARVKISSPTPVEGSYVVQDQTWIPEALDLLAADVDFASFDANADGIVQDSELSVMFVLNILYAQIDGAGAEANIDLNHPIAGANVTLEHFTRVQADYTSIGTPMHELGHHILELNHGPQPSEHDLMGLGAYNEDPVITLLHDETRHYATRPAGLHGLNKVTARFAELTRITETTRGVKLYAPETGTAFNVVELPVKDGFLYLENRTAWGYDQSIPFCDGHTGGLFPLDVSQYLAPLNIPAIAAWPPLASFSVPDEVFCDYYAFAGHNDAFSFGGWSIENVSAPGPVMTLDLVKSDVAPVVEHYKFRYWILNPDREGYRMWHWDEAPPNGNVAIDFSTFPFGDDPTGYFTMGLEAFYSTGEVRSVDPLVTYVSDSPYVSLQSLGTFTNEGAYLEDAIIQIVLNPSATYSSTATVSATIGTFQTSFTLSNLPPP